MTYAQDMTPGAKSIGQLVRRVAAEAKPISLTKPRLSGAYERAAAYLRHGASDRITLRFLIDLLRPQDLEPGARAVVWPSNETIGAAVGLRRTATKNVLNRLVGHDLIALTRSANGRRYGVREGGRSDGQLVRAFGIDLAPVIARYDELVAIGQQARVEQRRKVASWAEIAAIRRDLKAWATVAPGHSAAEAVSEAIAVAEQCRKGGTADALEACEARLTRLWASLEACGQPQADAAETGPQRPANRPRINLPPPINLESVMPALSEPASDRRPLRPERGNRGTLESGFKPSETPHLFPAVNMYLPRSTITWTDLDRAMPHIQRALGVSEALFERAERAMSPPDAIVALMLTAQRYADQQIGPHKAGAYYHGVVTRAERGRVDLARSIHGRRGARFCRT